MSYQREHGLETITAHDDTEASSKFTVTDHNIKNNKPSGTKHSLNKQSYNQHTIYTCCNSKIPILNKPHFRRKRKKFLPNFLVNILLVITCFTLFYTDLLEQQAPFPDKLFTLIQSVHGQREPKALQQPQYPSILPPKTQQFILAKTNLPDLIANQGGLIKDKNITLTNIYNPILITKDIIIKRGAKLIIEPGTELLFEKKKGIIVEGTLEILGSSNDRIKLNILKSQHSATVNYRSQNNNPTGQQQVRLVDGDTPNEGRVQIKFNDRWHSLCTNSKNLTAADIRVLCQQVGYQDGAWYKWFPKRNQTIYQIMSKSFDCSGTEKAISQCKRWNRVRAGGGICDQQSDIGIRCSKTLIFGSISGGAVYDYWRGIEFLNSETSYEYVLDGQMKRKSSKSILNHLTISDAGLDESGSPTAGVRVYGQPPKMDNIEIKNSIYGIMIEDVDDELEMNNIRLSNNFANPLFVNTSWGKVSLNRLHVENNGGDGIRIARHEKVLVGTHDFCKFANLGSSQSFPVVLSHEQTFFTSGQDCCQEFTSNNQLTVHFPVLRSTPNNLLPESDNNRRVMIPPGVSLGKDANLVIYDDYRDEFPFRLTIRNSTRAQSIVSKTGRLKICYEPAIYRTVLFTVEVVADIDDDWTGKYRDVEISNSVIKNNEGRGIWIENQRSGVKIFNTTVLDHNYLSGVHVENGTGEVIIQGSKISNNIGHGIFINLAGGYYHIDNSTISDNTQKGIMIEYDKRQELVAFNHTVHLGYSLISKNGENGIFIGNVCRSDANWNISMNSFIRNGEDAISFQSCLPTSESILNFRSHTSRTNISEVQSNSYNTYQELLVTHNTFLANQRRALSITPVFFLKSFIRHNLFKDHPLAVLYISNQALANVEQTFENSTLAPVNIRIASNRFYSNQGRYVVNIGLEEDNPKHALMFTKNYLEGNTISEPYTDLKPRSRVSAVVVVSSSNAKVIRNRFDNPQSNYELGSHLESHSKVISATANFWGRKLDGSAIYKRIFDRKNRYNLAQVEFLQYLMVGEDLEFSQDLSINTERDKITTFRNDTKLGGEVKGFEELPVDTYTVHDDIFIRPGAFLVLKPGTVLKFDDGVGMMVLGRLDAIGQPSSHIVFTTSVSNGRVPTRSIATTTPTPSANFWVSRQPEGSGDEADFSLSSNTSSGSSFSYKYDRRNILKKRQASTVQNIRLSHTTMGRLEVQIDGVWGSVCDYNFDIDDAAVACQQLGLIVNKDDWLLEKFQYAADDQQQISMVVTNVLMTNIRCDPSLDTDLTKCKAEISLRGDFDGMCDSEVGIRCFPPSWSGVRFGMGAETSTLEHVTIQKAGMFDWATYNLKPALQIDLYKHFFSSLIVKSNSDTGMGIMWSDVIGRHFSELIVNDSKFINNERHGIELRTRGLTFRNCSMTSNRQSGLDYNPTLTQRELNDLLSWLLTEKNSDRIMHLTVPLQKDYFPVPSSEDSFTFFIFQKNPTPDLKQQTFTIGTNPGHMLSVHLLNPIHPESTEQLNMSLSLNAESPIWDLRFNMTSFPMISPGYKFHFNYTTGKKPKGNIILYVRSRYNNRDLKLLTRYIPSHLVMHKFEQTAANINAKLLNSLVITNSNITKNGVGLKFKHSNYFYGHQGSFNRRYANETTNITNNLFDGNQFSSIYVGTEEFLSEVLQPQQVDLVSSKSLIPNSEINYFLVGNRFRRNKDGIRQFSRDIHSSYNVFHWSIVDTTFDYNRGGGINLLLPYFWRYDSNLTHSVTINSNSFLKNNQFELILDGHFVDLNLTKNVFKENKCKNALISFKGMEKRMLINYNSIEYNGCNRLVEFNIQSHGDKLGPVPATFELNAMRHNRKIVSSSNYSTLLSSFKYPKLLHALHPHQTDYALSLRGIQLVNLTRNLFVNPDLRFELVVATTLELGDNFIDAAENYWGTSRLTEINDRIFDFDDWNNYAIAKFSPYLTQDSFTSATILAESRELSQVSIRKPLGGRLTKSLTLPTRKEPYIIDSDLTVMPNVRLTIERGTTLEFMPNVGILVLGELVVGGTREKPIHMKPLLSPNDIMPLHQHLYPPKLKALNNHRFFMEPLTPNQDNSFRHYPSAYPIDMGSLRLCKNEICNDGTHIYENNIEDQSLRQEVLKSSNNTWRMDGFLEIFNMTTLQWVPVCDPLFTEQTAKVVCKQLGYSHLSLFKRGRRYTIEQEQLSAIKHWPDSVQCDGDESSLSSCSLAVLHSFNHSTTCTREGNQFIYVFCTDFAESSNSPVNRYHHGLTNEYDHHWGGIRFSCPSTYNGEGSMQEGTNLSSDTYNLIGASGNGAIKAKSRLQYLTVHRAGMLHRRRAPAIQVIHCDIPMEYVTVTNSAHHGVEMITSYGNHHVHQLKSQNNTGLGFNYLSLTGSSSTSRLVPYLPLKHLDTGYELYGLVNVCGASKEIQVEERLLIFYRYNSQAADCVKIISSKLKIKHIGIRMLQFDLFNSTSYTTRPDSIRIYDGNMFDRDSRLLVDLSVTERHRVERPELKFYQTTDRTMTVRVHVSGANSFYGFIAEVVTTPVSYNIQRDTYNNITFSEFTNNKLGAISVSSAGESAPNLIIKNNRIETNCLHLFGNFTSCISPIYMELQNCQRLKIINNLIKANQGGIVIKSYSHSAVSALEAGIENNVFESNQNSNALTLLGPKTDPYQSVKVLRNFFTRNVAPFSSNVVLSRIVANFSFNIISSNIGKHQIEVIGFDKLPLSYQTFVGNWIYNNSATLERDKSTIIGNSAGQQYRGNYIVNPDNHFELSTLNWSRYDVKPFHVPRDDEIIHLSAGDGSMKDVLRKTADAIPIDIVDTKQLDLYLATINAENNWWGFSTTPAIQGRIRDRAQHEELLKVDYVPFLETNHTVLSGICAGGWQKVGNACLLYIATRMTYLEAEQFCDSERATLPLLRGNHDEFSDFIKTQERDFDARVDKAWVRSFDVPRDACPALSDYRTRNFDCQDKYSFLCERDPQIVVSLLHWYRETGGLIALILSLITVLLVLCCTICWGFKSRHKYNEKLERKNSISIKAKRSLPYSSSNSLNAFHQRIYNPDQASDTDLSISTQFTQPSNDVHSNLVHLDPAYNHSRSRLDSPQGMINSRQATSNFESPLSTNPAYVSPTSHSRSSNKKSPSPSFSVEYVNSTPTQIKKERAQRIPPAIKAAATTDYVRAPSQQGSTNKASTPVTSFAPLTTYKTASPQQFNNTPTPSMNPDYIRPSSRERIDGVSYSPNYENQYVNNEPSYHILQLQQQLEKQHEQRLLQQQQQQQQLLQQQQEQFLQQQEEQSLLQQQLQQQQQQYHRFPTPPPMSSDFILPAGSLYTNGTSQQSQLLSNNQAVDNVPTGAQRSRTPSFTRLQPNDILTDPMPQLASAYSQIKHAQDFDQTDKTVPKLPPNYNSFVDKEATERRVRSGTPLPYPSPNQMRDIDESVSSVPTYYSNQIETYEESTESYIEAYNNLYNRPLQRNSQDEDDSSYVVTERSSITDLLINSTKIIRASRMLAEPHMDLVDVKHQSASQYNVNNEYGKTAAHQNKAFSETASNRSLLQQNSSRYLVETSFDDFDEVNEPTMLKQTSIFDSNQRLSPVSSTYTRPDSKLGSRVYLETSFE